jgi:sugar phosphate isomerase/epimerase
MSQHGTSLRRTLVQQTLMGANNVTLIDHYKNTTMLLHRSVIKGTALILGAALLAHCSSSQKAATGNTSSNKKMVAESTSATTASGISVIQRKGGAYIKMSLNAYSFSKLLNDNVKGRGNGMSLFELIDFAAQQNFDAVDLTGYFFPGYPKVPSDEFINSVKKHAFQLGVDISGTGVRNDFANPDPAKRAADVQHVKDWIDVAEKLGAPVVRIFSGVIPEGQENNWDSIAGYMAASIKECAEYGRQKGVLVGVQNHGDFLKTADQTIKLVKMVNSDWFGVIVDTGYFITPDPYVDIEKVMPYAVNFQMKESVFGAASLVRIDVPRVMKIIKKTGYRGYLPIETLSAAGGNKNKKDKDPSIAARPYDPYKLVPIFLKEIRAAKDAEFGDQ